MSEYCLYFVKSTFFRLLLLGGKCFLCHDKAPPRLTVNRQGGAV